MAAALPRQASVSCTCPPDPLTEPISDGDSGLENVALAFTPELPVDVEALVSEWDPQQLHWR